MQASLLGPSWEPHQIEHFLDKEDLVATKVSDDQLADHTARLIEDGQVVGWFQGRMEFGPRALGARSILGDPRRQDMQSKLNVKIKFRESFRPFAPSVLRERVQDYFELDHDSPYMLIVADVKRHQEKAPQIRFLTLKQIDEQLEALQEQAQLQTMVALYIYGDEHS